MSKRALAVASTTATLLAMDSPPYIELMKAIQEDPTTIDQQYYTRMHDLFIKLREDANVDYLYTQFVSNDVSCVFVLDSQEEENPRFPFSPPGFQENMLSSRCGAVFQNATALSTGIIEHERLGTSIFAHAPIMNQEKVLGVVSTGFSIATLEQSMHSMFYLILGLFILTNILVSSAICIVLRLRERSLEVEYLTQLGTKRFFENQLARVTNQAKALNTQFSLLLLDIDGFKLINDTYGHLTGDKVLQIIATIIRSHVQLSDICSRIGGDEFAIILTSSSLEQALLTAQAIQCTIREFTIEEYPEVELSVSIGVAQWANNQNPRELIELADQALYKAKSQVKNIVTH